MSRIARLIQLSLTAIVALVVRVSPAGAQTKDVETDAQVSVQTEKATDKPAEGDRSLDFVVAEHVILWDGKIVTWDEAIEGLREIRKRLDKPIHPNFHFTNGAIKAGYFDSRQKDLFQVYAELFEPVGMSLGSVSPRASPRYDAIKKPADLVTPPELLRKGIVRGPGGKPVRVGIVVLIPDDALMPVMLNQDLTLRDRLDEVWARLDNGRFELSAPNSGHRLAILSPVGFAVAEIPAPGKVAEIALTPSATLEIASKDKSPQELGLSIHPVGLPETFPGFSIYEVKTELKPAVLRLPPGRIALSRAFPLENGGSRLIPAEQFDLAAGQKRTLVLEPADEGSLPDK